MSIRKSNERRYRQIIAVLERFMDKEASESTDISKRYMYVMDDCIHADEILLTECSGFMTAIQRLGLFRAIDIFSYEDSNPKQKDRNAIIWMIFETMEKGSMGSMESFVKTLRNRRRSQLYKELMEASNDLKLVLMNSYPKSKKSDSRNEKENQS